MQPAQPILLRQVRDFGQIVTDTFRFLRQEGRPLFSAIAATCLPLALLAGFLVGKTVGDFQRMIMAGGFEDLDNFGQLGLALLGYFGIILVYVQLFAMVNEYLRAYHLGEHHGMRAGDLWRRGASQWGSYFGITFLIGLLSVVGIILCILPGIWIGVALVLANASHAIERTGATGGLKRSFALMKDRWWETFGLVIVVTLIQSVIAMALMLPLTIISFAVGINTAMDDGGPDAMLGWYGTYMAISTMVQTGLNMLTYPIVTVAVAMKYFTIVEEKEGLGLKQRIEGFDQA